MIDSQFPKEVIDEMLSKSGWTKDQLESEYKSFKTECEDRIKALAEKEGKTYKEFLESIEKEWKETWSSHR